MTEAPLISTMRDDPDLAEVIDEYVAALPARMDEIEQAVAAGDRARTEMLAHRIVGSAGGHGFYPIGEAARLVEQLAPAASPEVLAARVRELAALCARARAR